MSGDRAVKPKRALRPGLLLLTLFAIAGSALFFGAAKNESTLSRHSVSIMTVSELSREVLGTTKAEFPLILRIDNVGRLLDVLRGHPANARSQLEALGNYERSRGDNGPRLSSLDMIGPLSDSREKIVLVILSGGCEPCSQMEREFSEFARRRPDLQSFIVEAHVASQ